MYKYGDSRLPEKFWNKVTINNETECWVWSAEVPWGYGRISIGKKAWLAHRLAYATLVGEIPRGLCIDHLCRNRSCVNPEHLEAVTNRENILRSPLVQQMISDTAARQSSKTHCPKGHPYSGDNLVMLAGGRRACRACRNATQQRNYQRNAEERRAKSRAYHAANRDERRAAMRAAYHKRKAAISPQKD